MTPSPPSTVTLEWRLPHHAEALFAVMSDASLYQFVDTVHRPESVDALRQRITDNASRRSPDGSQHWLSWVVRDGSGALVGYVQATVHPDLEADIAYGLASAHWGRGLAARAVEQVLDLLARDYGAATFCIVAERANVRSVGLALRLGFAEVRGAASRRHALRPTELLLQRHVGVDDEAMPYEAAGMTIEDAVAASAATIRQRASGPLPKIAVLLGSGWAPLAERVQGAVDIPYADLPALPSLAVGGHSGLLRLGTLGGRGVALLAGRKHAYETGDADAMKGAIRTLAAIGVTTLLQTNAAGSLDAAMPPGTLMLINDHLNVVQRSPLVSEPGDGRFIDMGAAYDPAHRAAAQRAAARLGMPLPEGVYAWVLGPQFETPAEIRWLRLIGAQAVGMSTVPETILARHAGLRVLALSMMTNMAAGLSAETLSHGHTMTIAQGAAERAVALLEAVVGELET